MSIDYITSPLLSCPHGFFTRSGGVSEGVYHSLNCGFGSKDTSHNVSQNRMLVAQALGVQEQNLFGCYQVHSAHVLSVTQDTLADFRAGAFRDTHADGVVTDCAGVALGVLSADCQPILYADLSANDGRGVIGAAHAGWKGAVGGVIEKTLDKMCALGARRAKIKAVIGPCISQRNYEVGEEFLEEFLSYDSAYSRFFAQGSAGKYMFDLPSFGLSRLRAAGVETAEWVSHCTYEDAQHFYSYRRSVHHNEPDYGRLISAISLPDSK